MSAERSAATGVVTAPKALAALRLSSTTSPIRPARQYTSAAVTIERIGDLMSLDLPSLLRGRRPITVSAEVTR